MSATLRCRRGPTLAVLCLGGVVAQIAFAQTALAQPAPDRLAPPPQADAPADQPQVAPSRAGDSPELPARIARLIEQLGDDDYFVRERAHEELAEIGFEAFDALAAAENHDDVEIAARARHLLRRMRIDWIADDDAPEVKALLKNYESAGEEDRLKVLRALAELPGDKGLGVLCRMVRFEKSPVQSRQAALAVIAQRPIPPEDWPRRDETILRGIGQSPRPAAEWLKAYLTARRDADAAAESWARLADAEEKTWHQARHETRPEIAAVLLYMLAEARQVQGRFELARQAAERAIKLNDAGPEQHLFMGFTLEQRGLSRWAEGEFRRAIDLGMQGHYYTLLAQYRISEMLHDRGEEQAAAEMLNPFIQALEANLQQNQGNEGMNGQFKVESARARLHFFQACHWEGQGDRARQVDELRAALEADPLDADVLIALYRVPDLEPALAERTRKLIREATDQFRLQIQQAPDNPENSTPYNQLAWLVSNTEGDQAEALSCSLKSLELRPNTAGYLDTLGRCYYAQGDYANAVKYQTLAVEIDPHSGLMNKQLESFKQAADRP